MAIKSKSVLNVLTATPVAQLTADGNAAITVSKAIACNPAGVARNITIYHDITGTSGAITANIILYTYAIGAGETKTLPLSSVFVSNGGKLWAAADSAGSVILDINYTVTEQQP